MIERSEIEAVSNQLGIHTSHVQRDYVNGWLLSLLYSSSPLGEHLVLKGGNCLRKAYFDSGRYSRDLDFSTLTTIPNFDLGRELNAICLALDKRAGIKFEIDRTRVSDKRGVDNDNKISEVRLYFHDFYGQESEIVLGIRLDVTQFTRLYMPVQDRFLIHPYSNINTCSTLIHCVKLEELIATKMRCLLQRRHIADLFDIVYATFINNELEVDRSELLSVFFKTTIFGRSPGVAKGLFIDLPLEAIGRFWSDYIVCPQKSWFSFEKGKEYFLSLIENLIPDKAIHERSPILFPSSLRNPIMEAGQSFTLLRMGYDNIVRLVEPYSLAFKIRKDGIAREYFYAYDRTGGRSSGPGIKTFLPDKVQLIENTDRSFKPRYEVELRKAGGAEIVERFKGRPSLLGSSLPWRMENSIQCPYCSRIFKRKGFDTKLSPHKDNFGNPCPGRVGYRV